MNRPWIDLRVHIALTDGLAWSAIGRHELGGHCTPGPRLGHERLTQDQERREITRNDERPRIAGFPRHP
jgi:hypothetical protein